MQKVEIDQVQAKIKTCDQEEGIKENSDLPPAQVSTFQNLTGESIKACSTKHPAKSQEKFPIRNAKFSARQDTP